MTDELDKLFFEEIFSKVDEMKEIGKEYGGGVVALVIPISKEGTARMRLLRPSFTKDELRDILGQSYDWALRQVEGDDRLKAGGPIG